MAGRSKLERRPSSEDATVADAAAAAAAAELRIDLDAASDRRPQFSVRTRPRSRLKSCLVGIRAISSGRNDAQRPRISRRRDSTGSSAVGWIYGEPSRLIDSA